MDNDDVAHEHSDVDIRTILAFGAGMVGVVAVSFVLMWRLFRVLERQAAASDPQLSPLAADVPLPTSRSANELLPPEPRLQTNEPGHLEKFRMDGDEGARELRLGQQSGGRRAHADRGGEKADPAARAAGPGRRLSRSAGGHARLCDGRVSGGRTIGVPAPAERSAAAAGRRPPPAAGRRDQHVNGQGQGTRDVINERSGRWA